MPSNPPAVSRLDTVRATLAATLTPALPAAWKMVPHITAPAATQRTPTLYTEFTGISSQHGGQSLPNGLVFCDFDLVITVASTDDKKGEDAADAAVLDLIAAVDASESVAWDSAAKQRLDTGQLAWRLTLAVITHTHN